MFGLGRMMMGAGGHWPASRADIPLSSRIVAESDDAGATEIPWMVEPCPTRFVREKSSETSG